MKSPAADTPVTSRHVAKGVGTSLLARAGTVIEVVAQPLYVAMFGLASFGLYTVLWAAINLAENIFDLGMTSAMQRTVPQAKDDAAAVRSLRAAMLLGILPNLAVAILAVIFAPRIAPMLHVAAHDIPLVVPAIRIFAWALPLWAFVEIATSALRARHLFGAEIRLRIVWEQVIRLILATTFFFLGLGLTGLFLAHLMSLTVTVLLSVRLLARHYRLKHFFSRGDSDAMFSETFKAGLSVLPGNVVARLFGDAPSIILNMLIPGAAGASAAALFTISRKISSIVQTVLIAFGHVMAPLASSARRHDMAQVRDIYAYAVRLILAIALPLALVLAAGAGTLLRLFGQGAEVAQWAVVMLVLARAVEAITGISQSVQQVVSGYRRPIQGSLAALAVACVAGSLLVPAYGLTGMAASVGLGLMVMAVVPMVQLHIHDGIQPFDHGFPLVLGRVLVVALAGLALALLASRLPDALAIVLILLLALGTIWSSMRFALPEADRASLGKTARRLRLIPAS